MTKNRSIIAIIRNYGKHFIIVLFFCYLKFEINSQVMIRKNNFQATKSSLEYSVFSSLDIQIKVKDIENIDSVKMKIHEKTSKNSTEYLSEIPSIFPLNSQFSKLKISSNFSSRIHPISKKKAFHNGIDLPAEKNSLVYATADGVVGKLYTNPKSGIGFGIKLIHKYGYSSLYGHLLFMPKLVLWDSVTRGQVIGYVGNTGLSTGYHLHYTIYYKGKAVNPLIYCKLLDKL